MSVSLLMAWSVRSNSCRSLYKNATTIDPLNPPRINKKVIKQQQQQQKTKNWNVYQGMRYVTLDGKWMMKEDRLCNLRKRRNFYWRKQGNTKSCKVTTVANTNHFLQNLKKRYRFWLAIAVPQSGSQLHSGDRLFEWPKLSGKKNDKWKHLRVAHLHNMRFAVHTNIS